MTKVVVPVPAACGAVVHPSLSRLRRTAWQATAGTRGLDRRRGVPGVVRQVALHAGLRDRRGTAAHVHRDRHRQGADPGLGDRLAAAADAGRMLAIDGLGTEAPIWRRARRQPPRIDFTGENKRNILSAGRVPEALTLTVSGKSDTRGVLVISLVADQDETTEDTPVDVADVVGLISLRVPDKSIQSKRDSSSTASSCPRRPATSRSTRPRPTAPTSARRRCLRPRDGLDLLGRCPMPIAAARGSTARGPVRAPRRPLAVHQG